MRVRLALIAFGAGVPGCLGPWNPAWNAADTDPDTDPVVDTDPDTDTDTPIVVQSGSIFDDAVWRAGSIHELDGLVFVEGSAVLTIEPGALVRGRLGSALIVTRDAQLYARGTKSDPIVFTAADPPGSRVAGAWGGVVLLGNATVNVSNPQLEGIDPTDVRGRYGGSDDDWNCGTLAYARIEFAGSKASADKELNGLSLAGCGAGTVVEFIQVHRGFDDGVEVFGGTPDLRNVLVTQAGDDGLDWDLGWRGRAQFVIVQMAADDGDNGVEADSSFDALPRSGPTIFNLTLVGGDNAEVAQRGLVLREGTAARLANTLVFGFSKEALDLRDASTIDQVGAGTLSFDHSLFYASGADGTTWGPVEAEGSADDDDGGFDEAAWLALGSLANRFGVDPALGSPFDPFAPDFTPSSASVAASGAATPPSAEFFDEGATYLGAIRPGSSAPWTAEWTAFPEN